MAAALSAFAHLLRDARGSRGLSQLELAHRAGTTARHLSFLETGRSRPSEEMVLRLARALDVPLRARNALLRAAGLAPAYPERPLGHAELAPYERALTTLLAHHEPYPAFVVDAHYRILRTNRPARWFLAGLEPPVDAMALVLAPGGLRERLDNLGGVGWSVVDHLRGEAAMSRDPELQRLAGQAETWMAGVPRVEPARSGAVVQCPRFRVGDVLVRTFTVVMRFGHASDVTLAELRVELMFPEDEASAAVLVALGQPASA